MKVDLKICGITNLSSIKVAAENNIQKETAYKQADFFHKTLFQLTKNNFLLFKAE